jgi:hypothetical protein
MHCMLFFNQKNIKTRRYYLHHGCLFQTRKLLKLGKATLSRTRKRETLDLLPFHKKGKNYYEKQSLQFA